MRNGDPQKPGRDAPGAEPADPPPFVRVNDEGRAALLLTCDHASRLVPAKLANLGLTDEFLSRHIGWDIGAADVAREMARRLDAAAQLATVSRLVLDVNRDLVRANSIPEISDEVVIPGNRGLSAEERKARADQWFYPYHAALDDKLRALDKPGRLAGLVSVHSFTPQMGGFKRPWQIGVLWGEDGRIAMPLIERLVAMGLAVGDNQPYSGRHPDGGYAILRHGGMHGRPHVALEFRQDEVATESTARRWANLLCDALEPVLESLGLLAPK